MFPHYKGSDSNVSRSGFMGVVVRVPVKRLEIDMHAYEVGDGF